MHVFRPILLTGGKVILACRSVEKGEKVRKEIIDTSGNDQVKVLELDLASLASIQHFAESVIAGM